MRRGRARGKVDPEKPEQSHLRPSKPKVDMGKK